MMESDTQSSLVGAVTTVVQTLIKAPVKEAVREAIEEQRQEQPASALSSRETTADTDVQPPPLGRFLGVVLGLAAVVYLVRRRRRQPEQHPGSTKILERDIETGRGIDTEEADADDETDSSTQR